MTRQNSKMCSAGTFLNVSIIHVVQFCTERLICIVTVRYILSCTVFLIQVSVSNTHSTTKTTSLLLIQYKGDVKVYEVVTLHAKISGKCSNFTDQH